MVETLLKKHVEWLSGNGESSDTVHYCRCRLFRNLADFPFPSQCTDDEKRSIEERILGVLESLNLLESGQYWSLSDLSETEQRFLAERLLIDTDLLQADGPRGVYIDDDQLLSITINGNNHLTICGLSSGFRLQDIWSRISLIDDTLAGLLDYAFDKRLGYLTSDVRHVGTALAADVALHLPGLVMGNLIPWARELTQERRHTFETLLPGYNGSAPGDLYKLASISTLGRSEDEIIYHLKQLVSELSKKEREIRKQIQRDSPLHFEDLTGRALGLARGARLLEFPEAISVFSSLRLGVSMGLLDTFSLRQINEVFVASQNAHLEMKCGHECDELTLNAERAELFRSRFA